MKHGPSPEFRQLYIGMLLRILHRRASQNFTSACFSESYIGVPFTQTDFGRTDGRCASVRPSKVRLFVCLSADVQSPLICLLVCLPVRAFHTCGSARPFLRPCVSLFVRFFEPPFVCCVDSRPAIVCRFIHWQLRKGRPGAEWLRLVLVSTHTDGYKYNWKKPGQAFSNYSL